MAKELVVYKPKSKKSKISKGNIFAKASKEQKFLGKTLPKALLGVAKIAWRHPISTTVGWLAGEKLGKTTHLKFPQQRKWNKAIKGKYFL